MLGRREPTCTLRSKTFQPFFNAMANQIACKYLRIVAYWSIPVAFGLLWLDEPLSATPLDIKASLGGLLSCVTLSEMVNVFFLRIKANSYRRETIKQAMTTAAKKYLFPTKRQHFQQQFYKFLKVDKSTQRGYGGKKNQCCTSKRNFYKIWPKYNSAKCFNVLEI